MKIKNNIFESKSLNKFLLCNRLPIIMSFQIRNHVKKLQDTEKSYFEEKSNIIEKNNISDGNITPQFRKDMEELLNIETEITGEKLTIDIKKLPDDLLSPADIMTLENIFEFSENSEKKKGKRNKCK